MNFEQLQDKCPMRVEPYMKHCSLHQRKFCEKDACPLWHLRTVWVSTETEMKEFLISKGYEDFNCGYDKIHKTYYFGCDEINDGDWFHEDTSANAIADTCLWVLQDGV